MFRYLAESSEPRKNTIVSDAYGLQRKTTTYYEALEIKVLDIGFEKFMSQEDSVGQFVSQKF